MLPVLLDKIEQKECEEKAESLEKQFGIDQMEDEKSVRIIRRRKTESGYLTGADQ